MGRYAGPVLIVLMVAASTLVAQNADKANLIETIISAEQNGEQMLGHAAGRAIVNKSFVVIERPGHTARPRERDTREGAFTYVADFKLKGDRQRVTKYSYDASTGTRGERREDRIWDPEACWQYMPSAKSAEHQEMRDFPYKRALGEGFSMDVFKSVGGHPFALLMRNSLRDSDHWDASVREDGMMVIRCGYSNMTAERPKWEMELVLNPAADYSIMEMNHSWESQNGEGKETQCKADWEKKGDVWVPKHVSRQVVSRHDPNDATALHDTEEKCDVEIKDFDPTAQVADAVFTMDDLDMPAGTDILDVVANLNYRYKGHASEDKALTDSLGDVGKDHSRVAPPVVNPPSMVAPPSVSPPTGGAGDTAGAKVEKAVSAPSAGSMGKGAVLTFALAAAALAAGIVLYVFRRSRKGA